MMRLIFATPLLLLCVRVIKVKSQPVIYQAQNGFYFNMEELGKDNCQNWKKLRLLTLYAQYLFYENMLHSDVRENRMPHVESGGAMVDYFKGKFPPGMEGAEVNKRLDRYLGHLKEGAEEFVAEPINGQGKRYVVYVTRENVNDKGFQFPDFFKELPVEDVKFPEDGLKENSPYVAFLNSLNDEKLGQLNNLLMAGSIFHDSQLGYSYTIQGVFCTLNGFILKTQRPAVYGRLSIPWLGFTALVMPRLHPNVKTVYIRPLGRMRYLLIRSFPKLVERMGKGVTYWWFNVGEVVWSFPLHQVINSVDSHKMKLEWDPSEFEIDEEMSFSAGAEESEQPVDMDV